MAHDAVAGLVVDLPGRALERLEDDVLVEPRDHPVGQLQPRGVERVELVAGDPVLPGDDLLEPLGAEDPERGGELVHAVVEPVGRVVGLAVVAEGLGELDQLGVASRRGSRPRRSRSSSSARTTRSPRRRRRRACARSRRRRASARSPRSGRFPRRGRARRSARSRTRCARRCGRGRPRPACARATLRSKSANDMQRSSRLQSTNSTCAPASRIASGVAMNVFEGQRTVLPRSSKNSSAASADPVQARGRDRRQPVPGRPGLLEGLDEQRRRTTGCRRGSRPRGRGAARGRGGRSRWRTCRIPCGE